MNSRLPHDWVFHHAGATPDAPALATPAVRLGYAELAQRIRALASHLLAGGVGPGDRVVVALPNTPGTVVAGLAVQSIGATTVEVNREWGEEPIGEIVSRTGARSAFAWWRDARTWGRIAGRTGLERIWVVAPGPTLPPNVRDALGGAAASILLEDGRVDPAAAPVAVPAPVPAPAADGVAAILYTSGSTGRPRGVVQTFRNLDANTRSIVQYLGLTASDRALLVLPLYYCYGRSVLLGHLFAGGSVFLDGRFAFPRVVLEAMGSESCTGFAGVPLTFEIIRRQVDVSTLSLPRLRYLTQAGGPMAQETIDWVRQAFQPARLFVMYGQTEATARLSYLPPERAEEKRGSIGLPIPGVELRVVDEAGREMAVGEVGHLVARGENVTPGYLDEPEETAAILRDGWLWTGDLARRDQDGFLFHEGRSTEMLKIGGHRVGPAEIEHALALHPDVLEVAVIGEKDGLKGEVAVAYVVGRAGRSADEDELRRFCRDRLPAFKVPARIRWIEALPRNEAGKVLRGRLRSPDASPPGGAG